MKKGGGLFSRPPFFFFYGTCMFLFPVETDIALRHRFVIGVIPQRA